MRSLLFVPADSEKKLAKAFGAGADVVILDLEDSVAPDAKPRARALAAEAIASAPTGARVCVRVNPLASGLIDDDLAAVMPAGPALVMLPKSEAGRDVMALAARLAVHEAQAGREDGATRIVAIATETAAALFGLHTYAVGPRLAGLSWGAEDLAAALGATRKRDETGAYTDTFRLARTLCLAGAVAAEAAPIDTVFTDFRNEGALAAECEAAAADGFTGKLAIHPAQVPVINGAFTPSPEALAKAQRIIDAFAQNPGAGVVALDGEMIDEPHKTLAERTLARAPDRSG